LQLLAVEQTVLALLLAVVEVARGHASFAPEIQDVAIAVGGLEEGLALVAETHAVDLLGHDAPFVLLLLLAGLSRSLPGAALVHHHYNTLRK